MIKWAKESKIQTIHSKPGGGVHKILYCHWYEYDFCMAQRNNLLTEVWGFCWYAGLLLESEQIHLLTPDSFIIFIPTHTHRNGGIFTSNKYHHSHMNLQRQSHSETQIHQHPELPPPNMQFQDNKKHKASPSWSSWSTYKDTWRQASSSSISSSASHVWHIPDYFNNYIIAPHWYLCGMSIKMTQLCLISQMHAGNDGLLSNCKQQRTSAARGSTGSSITRIPPNIKKRIEQVQQEGMRFSELDMSNGC